MNHELLRGQQRIYSPVGGNNRISATYALWKKLPNNTFGSLIFSMGMCMKVPYFGSILPVVKQLEPGYCEVHAPLWFGVKNHLKTFHAIASCNMAEVAMGMLMEASTPRSHRWIPKGMTVRYQHPGKTRQTAIATFKEPINFDDITTGQDVIVCCSIRDKNNIEVAYAEITTWVSPVT